MGDKFSHEVVGAPLLSLGDTSLISFPCPSFILSSLWCSIWLQPGRLCSPVSAVKSGRMSYVFQLSQPRGWLVLGSLLFTENSNAP